MSSLCLLKTAFYAIIWNQNKLYLSLVVQRLLECCTSVKTKRLFMHAAEKLDHPWLSRLDLSNVNFGSGRRTIHAGGRLDKKYSLVVADPVQE